MILQFFNKLHITWQWHCGVRACHSGQNASIHSLIILELEKLNLSAFLGALKMCDNFVPIFENSPKMAPKFPTVHVLTFRGFPIKGNRNDIVDFSFNDDDESEKGKTRKNYAPSVLPSVL